MKPLVIVGIILLVLGVLALAYQGFSYVTREKVIDVGPVQVTADKEHSVALPPIIGGGLLLVGLVLVFVGTRRPA